MWYYSLYGRAHTPYHPEGRVVMNERTWTRRGSWGTTHQMDLRKSNSCTFVSSSFKMGDDNHLIGLLGGLNEVRFVKSLVNAYKIDPQ